MNNSYSATVMRKAVLCLAITLSLAGLAVSATEFTTVTSSAFGVLQQQNRLSWGNPIWGDIDGNGTIDLLIIPTNDSDPLVFKYIGNDNFTQIANGTSAGQSGIFKPTGYGSDWKGFAFGDYDGDGKLDLFVALNSKPGTGVKSNLLFKGNGLPAPSNTYFSQVTQTIFENEQQQSQTGFWVDTNNDGYLELFVKNYFGDPGNTGANHLYQWSSGTTFTEIIDSILVNAVLQATNTPPNGHGTICSFADYDNNRSMDVAFSGLRKALYQNISPGYMVREDLIGPVMGESLKGIAWGDYDNDGNPDLYVTSGSETTGTALQTYLFHNNGSPSFTFTPVTNSPVNTNYNTWAAVWGDYDNDGYLDLFVTCSDSKAGLGTTDNFNFLFHNKGRSAGFAFESVAEPAVQMHNPGELHKTAAWGDYNSDGFLDLVVKDGILDQAHAGKAHLVKNNGNTNHWVEINLQGNGPPSGSNKRGIGAKVEVLFGTETAFRQNNGGGGGEYDSQGSQPLHFGLGSSTTATAIVTWPSGTVDRKSLLSTDTDHIVPITEGCCP